MLASLASGGKLGYMEEVFYLVAMSGGISRGYING